MKENADKARALDTAEINKQLREGGEQMFRIRFQMSMGQAEGLKKLRSLRKERARMLTVLREREIKGDSTPVKAKPAKAAKTPAKNKAEAKPKTAKAPAAEAGQRRATEPKAAKSSKPIAKAPARKTVAKTPSKAKG